MPLPKALIDNEYCYLTTRGRVTGRPHTIEIWFGAADSAIYMLSGNGDRSDWVRNLRVTPAASVRIGRRHFTGHGRILPSGTAEDARARQLLLEKYRPHYEGDLTGWGRTALVVAIDVVLPPAKRSTRQPSR